MCVLEIAEMLLTVVMAALGTSWACLGTVIAELDVFGFGEVSAGTDSWKIQ